MAKDLIDKVRASISGRDEVIKALYTDTSLRKAVVGTLIKLGCDEAKAKDHFTDAIISFIKACYRPNLEIKSSLTNYIIGTAKNIWLKGVTKTKKERPTQDILLKDNIAPIEDTLISQEKRLLLKDVLNQLDDTCKKVLTLWSINKKMKAIAQDLQYKSEGMARKKKHQCLQRLYAIVDAHPHIKQELSSML